MGWGYSFDICPKCGCNNAPMVWLGKGNSWICEDCYIKEKEEENERFSDNHCIDMHDTSDNYSDKQP